MPSIKPLSTCHPSSSTRVWQSTVHPTLPLLAVASSDKTVRIYSLTSFTLLSTVSGGHKRSVRSVAWKPSSVRSEAILATGSFDASAGIWKKCYPQASDGEVQIMEDDAGGGVSVDGEGNLGDEHEDDEDYAFTVLLDGHESEIKSLSFSASSQFLATCSRDKSVWIWEDLTESTGDDNWETVAVLQEHDADVKCVCWHPAEDLLASGSYDDTIRLYKEDVDDWMQIAVLEGHEATVWWVGFEDLELPGIMQSYNDAERTEAQKAMLVRRKGAGPRLISCSDDLSIKVWQRQSKNDEAPSRGGMPSIIRSHSIEEDWACETTLPMAHERSIYSVSWSKKTGMVVSAGSDGKIVVYKERWKASANGAQANGTSEVTEDVGSPMEVDGTEKPNADQNLTEWVTVAETMDAHGVFEINHVCWAKRWDKDRKSDDEEVIVSTGDDGEVKIWTVEE